LTRFGGQTRCRRVRRDRRPLSLEYRALTSSPFPLETPEVHPYFDRLIKPLLERQAVDDDAGVLDMREELESEIAEAKEEATQAAALKQKRASVGME